MPDNRILNIVDEDDRVIGTETRKRIHRDGLLHRIIHVWMYTSRGEIIFQHRAPDKDTNPDLLDASVGGHVEIGQTYEQAAMQEIEEETGLLVGAGQLVPLGLRRLKGSDPVTHTIPHHIIVSYALLHDGPVGDLRVESGKATGFELWPIDTILNIPDSERQRFIRSIFDSSTLAIFRAIQKLIPNANA